MTKILAEATQDDCLQHSGSQFRLWSYRAAKCDTVGIGKSYECGNQSLLS